INDKLLRKISKKDLALIKNNNRYHSPEVSKTDGDDESTERKVVAKDLKWRSKTLKEMLRNYVDKIHDETVKVKPSQNRVYVEEFAEDKPVIYQQITPDYMARKHHSRALNKLIGSVNDVLKYRVVANMQRGFT
ncbi:2435_t:CDS:2, partial [Dentiscutata erythropus]